MGLLRFLLAAIIVSVHTDPMIQNLLPSPPLALKMLFIISGFYMSLVLTEKYTGPGRYRLFVTNRLLRLMPPYWILLALTLIVALFFKLQLHTSLMLGPWIKWLGSLSPTTILGLVTANITIYGQDLLFFCNIDPATHSLSFAADALQRPAQAWEFLLIPQAWTMSLEMTFYLLAPWLTRRGNLVLAMIAALSLGVSLYISSLPLPPDPWKARFFPAELQFFIYGIFSYRLYARLKTLAVPVWLPRTVALAFAGLVFGFAQLPSWGHLRDFVLYAATMASLPCLFWLTRRRHFDRIVAELAYPMYIGHWTIMCVVRYFCGERHLFLITLAATTVFSLIFNWLVSDRLERFRQRRVLVGQ
jgi:peptidoglycan/LPS O-acetylase OafA/YrhL